MRFLWWFTLILAVGPAGAALPRESSDAPKPLIQIGVEVVEVDENKSQQLGFDWISTLNVQELSAPALFKIGTITRSNLFTNIDFLVQEGAADVLANPKLLTRDGTTATFHAGGELPYATSGSLGTVNVEFKPYGVDLKINPHLDSGGTIALQLDAEVSAPDRDSSVTLSGNTVPGMLSRRLSSQLTMAPGTTLTIAGLIQNQKQTTRAGVPGISKVPVIGLLFSHKTLENRRTSIVVFVTPTIVDTDPAHSEQATVGSPAVTAQWSEQKEDAVHALSDDGKF